MMVVKRILRYIASTTHYGSLRSKSDSKKKIFFSRSSEVR